MKSRKSITETAIIVTRSVLTCMVRCGVFAVCDQGILGPTVWDITHTDGWSYKWAVSMRNTLGGAVMNVVGTKHCVFAYNGFVYDAQNPEGVRKADAACLHALSGISKSRYVHAMYETQQEYFAALSRTDQLNLRRRRGAKPVTLRAVEDVIGENP